MHPRASVSRTGPALSCLRPSRPASTTADQRDRAFQRSWPGAGSGGDPQAGGCVARAQSRPRQRLPTSLSSAAASSFRSPSPSASVSSACPSASVAPGPAEAATASSDAPVSPPFSAGDSQAPSITAECGTAGRGAATLGAWKLTSCRRAAVTSPAGSSAVTQRQRPGSTLSVAVRDSPSWESRLLKESCSVYRRTPLSLPPLNPPRQ